MSPDWWHARAAAFSPALINPPVPGPGICATCRGPAPPRARECSSCRRMPQRLDAVLPISWSVAGGPLHRALRGYKDDSVREVRDEWASGLQAVLECFLREHERCAAAATGVGVFGLITTVPSRADRARGPLRALVRACPSTAGRYGRVLGRGVRGAAGHRFDPERFRAVRSVRGEAVLLIDVHVSSMSSTASPRTERTARKRSGSKRWPAAPRTPRPSTRP